MTHFQLMNRRVNEALTLITGWQAEGLTEGAVYQFQVYAANLAGLGPASKHSADFTCEVWTMPEPGECDHLTADSLQTRTENFVIIHDHIQCLPQALPTT